MMTKHIGPIAIFTIVISLVAASPVRAEISRMTVHVDGLSCPFCVFNVEKRLKRVRDVEHVDISLKTGNATMVLGKGRGPTVAEVRGAVQKAGFTPGIVGLTAIGTLSVKDKYVLLNVRRSNAVEPTYQSFYLYQKGQGSNYFDEDTRKRLETLAMQDTVVAITGSVREHAEGLPALSTDKITVLPKRKEKQQSTGERAK